MTLSVSNSVELAGEVAAAARLASRAGLVEGFGHVSARTEEGFVITGTSPLGAAEPEEMHTVLETGEPADPDARGLPLETPLHAAIYSSRSDVAAIVRGHPPALVAADAAGTIPPLLHGLGGLSGQIAKYDDVQLVTDAARASAAADSLGAADALVLHRNGSLAVAADLDTALVHMWFMEERARVWTLAGDAAEFADAELTARAEHWPAEARRAAAWLRWQFGDGGES